MSRECQIASWAAFFVENCSRKLFSGNPNEIPMRGNCSQVSQMKFPSGEIVLR
jgi:hypothetical protein